MSIFAPNDVELQVVTDIVDRQKRGLNKYGRWTLIDFHSFCNSG